MANQANIRSKRIKYNTEDDYMLPGLPLPSPDLCLLNSRPLSCLYGEAQEHSHRRCIRQTILQTTDTGQDDGESDSHAHQPIDEPVTLLSRDEVLKELKLYENTISYIGLRIASKRNAMATLATDMGDIEKGFNLLQRAGRLGTPFLPMNALIKAIQACQASDDIGNISVTNDSTHKSNPDDPKTGKSAMPIDMSQFLDNPEDARKLIESVVKQAMDNITKGNKTEFTLKDLSQLPVVDNMMMSLLAPLNIEIPESKLVADLIGPAVQPDVKPEPLEENSATCDSGDTEQSKQEYKPRPFTERLLQFVTKPMSIKSLVKFNASAKNSDRGSKASKVEVSNEQTGDVDDHDTESALDDTIAQPPEDTPEADLTVDQMLENLENGKLCNGADAKNPRDLVISILVAGLYEFLSVDFFNHFLQDKRLAECFEHTN
ncbi:hypothetical protein BBOV_III002750 [Babesia bovis T2Bo]|uniref:Uncharacterized protein n=1 Tax=Babesia bovis TaxID=5865 RepID=A7AMQ6_BABBO|nr:hypothetical protein BBOV_III002750 [Babesia bovis T2Bo]EDO07840.1 hypothetical protein BBOV_III002750 [Babesia bovis T2Bo]|eukprot:XP_001611408.1 hypothetical protein [Babesia bovis T2Bo]